MIESTELTKRQQEIFLAVRDAVIAQRTAPTDPDKPALTFINDFGAGDKKFLTQLASELNVTLAWDEFDNQDRNVASLYLPAPPVSTRSADQAIQEDGDGEWEDASSEDDVAAEESIIAIDRVLNRYSSAVTLPEGDDEFDKREAEKLKAKMDEWKQNYYKVSLSQFAFVCLLLVSNR